LTKPIPVGLGLPWLSIGIAEASLDEMRNYAMTRVIPSTGRPLAHMQWVRHAVADATVELEAARLMAERMLWVADFRPAEAVPAAIKTKLVANKAAQNIASAALAVGGGSGYLKSSPIERHFRDAQAGALMAYSVELCRELIGENELAIHPGAEHS
jgi:alkylation response protein AidB-like acyl-CoA dehydrogenase